MFCSCKVFVKAYINDIVIFLKLLYEHIEHLRQMFQIFKEKRVNLTFNKSFIGYSFIQFLDQKINNFDLIIFEEKIVVIIAFKFSKSLSDLNHFFKLIDWLRHCVHWYVQKILSLQIRKIALICQFLKYDDKWSVIKSVRKKHVIKLILNNFSDEKIIAFKLLQRELKSSIFLMHFNFDRRLYIDLNASKKWSFVVMIYHLLNDSKNQNKTTIIIRTSIQLIMYLNKMFNLIEQNYWLTKLKVIDIIWMIKKIRHMIEFNRKLFIIIYTDHFAIILIFRQIILIILFIDKLNLRLIRVSQYLFNFNIFLRHKTNKTNIIFNILFRLPTHTSQMNDVNKKEILNILYGHSIEIVNEKLNDIFIAMIYHIILIKMSNDFKQRLKKTYAENKHWSTILKMLKQRAISVRSAIIEIQFTSNESASKAIVIIMSNISNVETKLTSFRDLQFECRNELIYYLIDDDKQRLCILKIMQDEIFKLIHDQIHHEKFQRTYDRLCHSIYIRRMIKHLKQYIKHCSKC